jgi:hypothetical protein
MQGNGMQGSAVQAAEIQTRQVSAALVGAWRHTAVLAQHAEHSMQDMIAVGKPTS